eukprot:m51a1_g9189 hypothetical protein (1311) ;mRNA; f:75601-80145
MDTLSEKERQEARNVTLYQDALQDIAEGRPDSGSSKLAQLLREPLIHQAPSSTASALDKRKRRSADAHLDASQTLYYLAHKNLASVAAGRSEPDSALYHYQMARPLPFPPSPGPLLPLTAAVALEMDATDAAVLYAAGEAAARLGRLEDARRHLSGAVARNAAHGPALDALVDVLARLVRAHVLDDIGSREEAQALRDAVGRGAESAWRPYRALVELRAGLMLSPAERAEMDVGERDPHGPNRVAVGALTWSAVARALADALSRRAKSLFGSTEFRVDPRALEDARESADEAEDDSRPRRSSRVQKRQAPKPTAQVAALLARFAPQQGADRGARADKPAVAAPVAESERRDVQGFLDSMEEQRLLCPVVAQECLAAMFLGEMSVEWSDQLVFDAVALHEALAPHLSQPYGAYCLGLAEALADVGKTAEHRAKAEELLTQYTVNFGTESAEVTARVCMCRSRLESAREHPDQSIASGYAQASLDTLSRVAGNEIPLPHCPSFPRISAASIMDSGERVECNATALLDGTWAPEGLSRAQRIHKLAQITDTCDAKGDRGAAMIAACEMLRESCPDALDVSQVTRVRKLLELDQLFPAPGSRSPEVLSAVRAAIADVVRTLDALATTHNHPLGPALHSACFTLFRVVQTDGASQADMSLCCGEDGELLHAFLSVLVGDFSSANPVGSDEWFAQRGMTAEDWLEATAQCFTCLYDFHFPKEAEAHWRRVKGASGPAAPRRIEDSSVAMRQLYVFLQAQRESMGLSCLHQGGCRAKDFVDVLNKFVVNFPHPPESATIYKEFVRRVLAGDPAADEALKLADAVPKKTDKELQASGDFVFGGLYALLSDASLSEEMLQSNGACAILQNEKCQLQLLDLQINPRNAESWDELGRHYCSQFFDAVTEGMKTPEARQSAIVFYLTAVRCWERAAQFARDEAEKCDTEATIAMALVMAARYLATNTEEKRTQQRAALTRLQAAASRAQENKWFYPLAVGVLEQKLGSSPEQVLAMYHGALAAAASEKDDCQVECLYRLHSYRLKLAVGSLASSDLLLEYNYAPDCTDAVSDALMGLKKCLDMCNYYHKPAFTLADYFLHGPAQDPKMAVEFLIPFFKQLGSHWFQVWVNPIVKNSPPGIAMFVRRPDFMEHYKVKYSKLFCEGLERIHNSDLLVRLLQRAQVLESKNTAFIRELCQRTLNALEQVVAVKLSAQQTSADAAPAPGDAPPVPGSAPPADPDSDRILMQVFKLRGVFSKAEPSLMPRLDSLLREAHRLFKGPGALAAPLEVVLAECESEQARKRALPEASGGKPSKKRALGSDK